MALVLLHKIWILPPAPPVCLWSVSQFSLQTNEKVKQVHKDDASFCRETSQISALTRTVDEEWIHRGALPLWRVLMQDGQDEHEGGGFHCTLCCLLHSVQIHTAALWRAVVIHELEEERLLPSVLHKLISFSCSPSAPVKTTKHSSW